MKSTAYRIQQTSTYVKPQPAELPRNYDELVQWRYTPKEGREAVERLAQGEIDVLETCRQALGWLTITSLATKWYPLYPSRKAWARALSHCRQFSCSGQLKTRTLNLKYLLKAVITHFCEQLQSIYGTIRIPSILPIYKSIEEYSNTSFLADLSFPGVARAPLPAGAGGGT